MFATLSGFEMGGRAVVVFSVGFSSVDGVADSITGFFVVVVGSAVGSEGQVSVKAASVNNSSGLESTGVFGFVLGELLISM